jgi:hypothetical protein
MRDFDQLTLALRDAGIDYTLEPAAPATIEDPAEFLVIVRGRYVIDVVWRRRIGFGISAYRDGESAGFDGPDEIYRHPAEAALRITELATTESRTDRERSLSLAELRLIRNMTQRSLAALLGIDVSVVTKRESGASGSMRLGTLNDVVQALGGELEIAARFGQERRVLQFKSRESS